MIPTTPTRTKNKPTSAFPSALRTPRQTIGSENSFSDNWWTEQQREQQGISGRDHTIRPSKFSLYEAELMDSHTQSHNYTTTSPIEVSRRCPSVISATSLHWNHSSAGRSSLVDQSDDTTDLEPIIPAFEDDHSEYGSEQENQPPAEVPSTPPTEHTFRRLQREPLKHLPLDRNGRPLHTISSLAEQSCPYPELAFVTPSHIDEDEEFDIESNASTIVLPTIRKRRASVFEEDEEKENNAAGYHNVGPSSMKRVKTLHHTAKLGSPDVDENSMHTTASPATRFLSKLNAPPDSDIDGAEESDSESGTSKRFPASRKRDASHLEEEEEAVENKHGSKTEGSSTDVTKRRKPSPTELGSLRNFDTGKAGAQQEGDHITFSGERFIGRKQHPIPVNSRIHSTEACPQRNGRSYVKANHTNDAVGMETYGRSAYFIESPKFGITAPPSSPAGLDGNTLIGSSPTTITKTGMRLQESFHIQTPAKTSTLISFQQILAGSEPMDDVLSRLEEEEEKSTRWLAEVRRKKDHYRRIMAEQQKDRRAIEEDMARLVHLEPIIQVMASEKLHKIEEAIRVHEGQVDRLSEQRKKLRQRVLGFEALRHDLEEERRAGL